MHVSKVEYTSYSGAITINGAVSQDFILTGAYSLSGYLRDPSGMPVPGAVVVVSTQQGDQRGIVAADGRYRIEGLILGKAFLSIYRNTAEASIPQTNKSSGEIMLTGNMTKDIT